MGAADLFCFGDAWPAKTEAAARRLARRELRRRGFTYCRVSKRWSRDTGYGLINFEQRWLRLGAYGDCIMIVDKQPPRLRNDQAFVAARGQS